MDLEEIKSGIDIYDIDIYECAQFGADPSKNLSLAETVGPWRRCICLFVHVTLTVRSVSIMV